MAHSKLTNLKAQRVAAGFSIGDLAKKAGLSDWDVVNTESNGGTLRNHDAAKLATALAVSLSTLGQVEL
jgi:ribosome-binding protein aMBF1 (putative translation factor)